MSFKSAGETARGLRGIIPEKESGVDPFAGQKPKKIKTAIVAIVMKKQQQQEIGIEVVMIVKKKKMIVV